MTDAIELLKSALDDLNLVNVPVDDDAKELGKAIKKITIAVVLLGGEK
jgi:hypothetical protein